MRNFPALEWLDLRRTKITDRSLDAVAALPNLRTVALDKTAVTSAGLEKLRNLKNLSQISAVGLELTDDELAQLKIAMPDVQIVVDDAMDLTWTNP